MRNTGFSIVLIGFVILAWAPNTFAQDYTRWGLPEGAKARLGKGRINEIAYSPDGTRLAVASSIGIWIYDAQTGEELDLLIGPTSGVRSVSFSPDGQTIASVDGTIRLWDTDTGTHRRTLTGSPLSVAFSPDGNTIASGSWDDTIRLWDAHTGRHIRTLTGHTDDVNSVAFSPDGNTIASGSDDETICLWDAHTGRHIRTLTGHTDTVNSVAFSPDGKTIASWGSDRTIRLWDADTGEYLRILTGYTLSVAFSPDGKTIASGGWEEIRLWDADTGRNIQTLTGHTGSVSSVAFSPDGKTIASGGGWEENAVRLWDADTGRNIRTLTGHTGLVSSVAFSPDGKTIASGGGWEDYTVRLWDADTGRNIRTLTGHTDDVNSVAFSPDGNTIASGSDDETIRLWDADTGTHIQTLTGHTDDVNSVAFSPDGNTIASGSWDDTIRLWDADTGRHIRTLGHTDFVFSVAFSPDGNTLASGSSDDTIRLWDADIGEHIRTLAGHTGSVRSVAFSPDGNTLASGSYDGTVLLWHLAPASTSNATLSLSPVSVQSPTVGEQLTFSLKIADAENVAGYQATVSYDTAALRYVESANGDYLPSGAFFIPPVAEGNTVTLAASSLTGESNGDGTLATLTFEIVAVKASTVRLTNVLLTDASGGSSVPQIENAEITEPLQLPADVNGDGIVNIIDLTLVASNFGATGQNAADVNGDGVVNIIDLTLVAGAFGNTASAPEIWSRNLDSLTTRAQVEQWLNQARQVNRSDPTFQRGLLVLEQLLAALTPKETVLLPNYPNPFNPETWIPYQLAKPADVSISIYAVDGQLVRTLDLGHQSVGIYESRSRAAYWDGRNALGEPVASSVYFYTLTAGDFTATRKMLIRK